MSYVHSHPYYWDYVVNFGDFGLWISITASNLQQWANWHFGGNTSLIYSVPGCSPEDFTWGGAWWMWMADDGMGTGGPAWFGPYSWGTIWANTNHPWIGMRKSHTLMGLTVAETYNGVGMPGVIGIGQNSDPFVAINQANTVYPQYANAVNHPVHGLAAWAFDQWLQYNELPFTQISNGNTPNQCAYWFRAFVYYLDKIHHHIHGNTPGSYSNVQIIASGPNQGLIANIWIYKYNSYLSKAHWAQTGSEGCGCGPIFELFPPEFWGQYDDPYWGHWL